MKDSERKMMMMKICRSKVSKIGSEITDMVDKDDVPDEVSEKWVEFAQDALLEQFRMEKGKMSDQKAYEALKKHVRFVTDISTEMLRYAEGVSKAQAKKWKEGMKEIEEIMEEAEED